MHIQAPRSFRYITFALLIDTLDMFPPNAVGAHRVFWWRRQIIPTGQKRVGDIGRISWFAQVIGGADFNSCDSRRNCSVTSATAPIRLYWRALRLNSPTWNSSVLDKQPELLGTLSIGTLPMMPAVRAAM